MVDNAIRNIQNVQNRVILTTTDIEQNIHDILKAIDFLLTVKSADITTVRLLIDELLMTWESRHYPGFI
jgi:hypothetical protein